MATEQTKIIDDADSLFDDWTPDNVTTGTTGIISKKESAVCFGVEIPAYKDGQKTGETVTIYKVYVKIGDATKPTKFNKQSIAVMTKTHSSKISKWVGKKVMATAEQFSGHAYLRWSPVNE